LPITETRISELPVPELPVPELPVPEMPMSQMPASIRGPVLGATRLCWIACALPAWAVCVAGAEEPMVQVSRAAEDEHGLLRHTVQSPYQADATIIRVLLPADFDRQRRYRVLYVLPVEAKRDHRYGDGLLAVRRAGLHDRHDLVCVEPTFSHLPWYADHPSDPTIRQESYLLRVVLPAVERRYPTLEKPAGRLLVGFSKSGWGAYSLLLRHPDVFGKAAAWDAPLMKDRPDQFGMGPIFGSQQNFAGYQVTKLLNRRAALLQDQPRLILTGYGSFADHHRQAHRLMQEFGIRHTYRDGPHRRHHWDSGWLAEAVGLLVGEKDE